MHISTHNKFCYKIKNGDAKNNHYVPRPNIMKANLIRINLANTGSLNNKNQPGAVPQF